MAITSAADADRGAVRPSRRRYESPLRSRRAEETRTKLLRSATQLFTTSGWASTGMRDVASQAGVAVETLYKHFPSKRKLLDAVIDEAAAGDAAPIPIADRPEFRAMGEGRRSQRIEAAAAVTAAIHGRTAPFARLIRQAATTDPEIAEVLRATRERQRADVEAGLSLVLGRAPTQVERDGAWAVLSPEVHLLLVEETGWSLDEYRRWLVSTLAGMLPRA